MAQEHTDTEGNTHDTADAPETTRSAQRDSRTRRTPMADFELPENFAALDERVRATVQERPFVALGAAVVAGYLLGRVLSRR